MLYAIDSDAYVNYIPHFEEYQVWVGRLTSRDFDAIVDKLNDMINGDEIHTSSWMPGANWAGTVFQPIYENACRCNVEAAGKCFGLILWKVLMDRQDVWGFGRYEINGEPIKGMTYFRITPPKN